MVLFIVLHAMGIKEFSFCIYIIFQMPRKEPDRSLEGVDIEARITTIEGLLQRTVTEEVGGALEVMLVNAVEERRRRQQMDLQSLMSKYGLGKTHDNEDIINVDDSPTGSVSKLKKKVAGSKIATRKHPSPKHSPKVKGKKTSPNPPKKTNISPKPMKSPRVSPRNKAKIVKGPPTKRKKELPKQQPSSDSDHKTDSDFQPDSCATSDSDGPQSKKPKTTPGRSITKKKRGGGVGKRPDLVWCSSTSDLSEDGLKKEPVIYTNEEIFTLYDTIDADP